MFASKLCSGVAKSIRIWSSPVFAISIQDSVIRIHINFGHDRLVQNCVEASKTLSCAGFAGEHVGQLGSAGGGQTEDGVPVVPAWLSHGSRCPPSHCQPSLDCKTYSKIHGSQA